MGWQDEMDSMRLTERELRAEIERLRAAIETALRGFYMCNEFGTVIEELSNALNDTE